MLQLVYTTFSPLSLHPNCSSSFSHIIDMAIKRPSSPILLFLEDGDIDQASQPQASFAISRIPNLSLHRYRKNLLLP